MVNSIETYIKPLTNSTHEAVNGYFIKWLFKAAQITFFAALCILLSPPESKLRLAVSKGLRVLHGGSLRTSVQR